MSLDPLLHMLGLDEDRREPWRNHYVTDAADPAIVPLLDRGLVEQTRAPAFLSADDRVYRATGKGRIVAIEENNRRNPPPSRARARYLHWVGVADAVGCSFGEWLKRGGYKTREVCR